MGLVWHWQCLKSYKMEVLPISLIKGWGSSTVDDPLPFNKEWLTGGGGGWGSTRRGAHQSSSTRPRSSQQRRPSSMPFSTVEAVSSILAMSSRPAPCGSSATTIAFAMRVARPALVLWLVATPWRSFWTRHGGARGRRRRGKPWESGEEHQEGGVQSCSPSTWCDFNKRKWECERKSECYSLQI